jgi:predicted permease
MRISNHLWHDLARDVRYACRTLLRQPTFTVVAIGTLAVALGVNSAMFGLAHRLLIADLPVRDADRLVLLSRVSPDHAGDIRFPHLFVRHLSSTPGADAVLDGVLSRAVGAERVTVGTDGGGQATLGELVSGNFFEVLGVRPHVGRLFTAADDVTPGAHPVVVLSHGYWLRGFNGDPAIVGKTLRITGVPMTVIGVSPPGFEGLDPGQTIDLRFPLAMQAEVRGGPARPGAGPRTTTLTDRRASDMIVVGRLRRGVSLERAEQVLGAALQRYLEEGGAASTVPAGGRQPDRIRLESAAAGIGLMRAQYGRPIRVLLSVTLAMLVIACLNLANLMLVRSSTRARELAIRVAIGADSGRLVRQLLTESFVLSLAGGAGGALLIHPISAGLARLLSSGAPASALTVDVNVTVLLFHVVTAVASVSVFGALPALSSRRIRFTLLRTGTAGATSVAARRWFLGAQVAVSIVVLVGALLFVRTVHALRSTDLGLRTDRLLVLALSPQNAGRSVDLTLPFFRAVHERVAALPGVTGVTYAWVRPLSNTSWQTDLTIAGCCADVVARPSRNVVGPSYFETMGNPIVAGRDFTASDDRNAPKVAIVNETFARVYGRGANVLGARIGITRPEYTIVGIARDAKYAHVREAVPPVWYVPYEQQANVKYLNLYVRTSGDLEGASAGVRAAIAAVDRDVALFEVRSVEAQLDGLLAAERTLATLATFFGSTAVVLAAIGVYGMLAFILTTRRREIGIRMALGARPQTIRRHVLAEALWPVAFGALTGTATAVALMRYTASLLYGVTPLDVVSFGAGVLVVVVVISVAAMLPARRASRLDPALALRDS